MTQTFPVARRLPDSNNYDDVRIDIPASFKDVRTWLAARRSMPIASRPWRNRWRLCRSVLSNRMPGGRTLLGMPIHDERWFGRFQSYWSQVLGGVKIDLGDFFIFAPPIGKGARKTSASRKSPGTTP